MNKKKLLGLIMAFAISFFIFAVGPLYKIDGDFCLQEYQSHIELNQCNESLGPIKNAAVARIKAEQIWRKKLGRFMKNFERNTKSTVLYDAESKAWIVTKIFDRIAYGGYVIVIFTEAEGNVLALNGVR